MTPREIDDFCERRDLAEAMRMFPLLRRMDVLANALRSQRAEVTAAAKLRHLVTIGPIETALRDSTRRIAQLTCVLDSIVTSKDEQACVASLNRARDILLDMHRS